MSDPTPDDADPTADTERFQAFVRGGADDPGPRSNNAFRVLTLIGGLVVLGLLVWVLLTT